MFKVTLHKVTLSAAIGAAMTVLGAGAANAAVFSYEQAWNLTDGAPACSSCGDEWRAFDSFTLDTETTITSIATQLDLGNSKSMELSIWEVGGTSALYDATYDLTATPIDGVTVTTVAGEAYDTISATVDNWTLAAGTYWLGVWNGAVEGQTLTWYGAGTGSGTFNHCSDTEVEAFITDGQDCFKTGALSMSITGETADVSAVPLPAGLPLMIGALAAFGLVARRKA